MTGDTSFNPQFGFLVPDLDTAAPFMYTDAAPLQEEGDDGGEDVYRHKDLERNIAAAFFPGKAVVDGRREVSTLASITLHVALHVARVDAFHRLPICLDKYMLVTFCVYA